VVIEKGKKAVVEEDEDLSQTQGPSCLILVCVFILILELGAAVVAVLFWDDVMECCGESAMSKTASGTEKWNLALYGIAVGYLTWTIVAFPIIKVTHEPIFLFNPMIGFFLAIHMLYVTNVLSAYIIYGLETVAMLGQTYILCQIRRRVELLIHTLANFTMSLLVIYMILHLSFEGGYCIVDGELQSIFSNSTCNKLCTDDLSCNVCTADVSSCFISFS
jgi:hypothetical protein